jgi:sarcosine oxidase subunit alpha
LHDGHYRSSVRGIYVSGNTIGVEGAEVAMAQGRAAGYAVALDATGDDRLASRFDEAEAEVRTTRRAADIRFIPTIDRGRAAVQDAWRRYGAEGRAA